MNLFKNKDGTITYKGIIFDDWNDNQGIWSEICEHCIEKYRLGGENISDNAMTIACGVQGCTNDADFYIDFNLGGENE